MNQELIDDKNKMIELTLFINDALRSEERITKWSYYATENYLKVRIKGFNSITRMDIDIYFDFGKSIEELKEQFLYYLRNDMHIKEVG